jgi:hypothetical protein
MTPIRVTASSGRISITAEARDDVVIDQGQDHPMGGVLEVKGRSDGVVMRVPLGSDLVVGSHSGAVQLKGALGELRVTSRSGRVEIDECASLDVRTVSGRVVIGSVTGECRIKTGSGRISITRADGELHVATVSGRIDIVDAAGPVRVNTVNGRVDLGMTRAADARADSVSGRVTIELPHGVHPKTSLVSVSGRCECELDEGDDCRVTGRTVSGRIAIRERR